jgi:hypothetical protein
MPGSCCQKPFTKIIRVGTFEAGIVGYEAIMKNLAESEWTDEQELAIQLLSKAREHGNYINPATEELYKLALLREFRLFVGKGAQKK